MRLELLIGSNPHRKPLPPNRLLTHASSRQTRTRNPKHFARSRQRAGSEVDDQPVQFRNRDRIAADVAWDAVRLSSLSSRISERNSVRRRARQGEFDGRLGPTPPSLEIDDAETPSAVDAARCPRPPTKRQERRRTIRGRRHFPLPASCRIAVANSAPIHVCGMSPTYSGVRNSLQTTSAQPRQPRGLRPASTTESSRKASSYRPKDTKALRLRKS